MGAIRAALLDAVVAALPVALVYFAGWAYLSGYLDAFGIDYTQVNIPLTTVLVYAFTPLSNWKVFVPAGALLLIWQVVALSPKCRKIQSRTSVTSGAIVLVLMLFLVRWVAANEAQARADNVWSGQKSITQVIISNVDTKDKGYQKFVDCRSNDMLRQILGLPEQTFLLCLNKKWPENGILFAVKSDGTIAYFAGRINDHGE